MDFPIIIQKDTRQTEVLFNNDYVFIFLMSLMGFTGGFLGSKAMFFASANAPKHLQDDTGNIFFTQKHDLI